jgi:hypothetical protein
MFGVRLGGAVKLHGLRDASKGDLCTEGAFLNFVLRFDANDTAKKTNSGLQEIFGSSRLRKEVLERCG